MRSFHVALFLVAVACGASSPNDPVTGDGGSEAVAPDAAVADVAQSDAVTDALAAGDSSLPPERTGPGRIFYVDYASGSNANTGTSKASPWKTHPYMQQSSACTGGTVGWGGYSHVAGDQFVFKGGVTWPASCFKMVIASGGTATAQDYYGAEGSWFAGASFTRPLFDMNAETPTGNYVIQSGTGQGYFTLDFLEIAHQHVVVPFASVWDGAAITFLDPTYKISRTGTVVSNCYVHDWVTSGNVTVGSVPTGGILDANIVTRTEISDEKGYAYIHGVKTDGAFGVACSGCADVGESKIHHVWAGCFTASSCHDNELYGITQNSLAIADGAHSQVIEDDEPCGGTTGIVSHVYNNLIHDNQGAGVTIFVRYYSEIYNNVLWNNGNYGIRLCKAGETSTSAGHIYNNIIDATGSASVAIGDGGSGGIGSIAIKNNIFLGVTGTGFTLSTATVDASNNYVMSAAQAATYGYTSTTKYHATSTDPSVSAQGANLSSLCTGSLTALCYGSEGAPWFGGSYVARPAAGGWNLGAYQ